MKTLAPGGRLGYTLHMPLDFNINTRDVITDDPTDRRLAELILFVANRCTDDKKFGATKLNKILFFSDFVSMRRQGKAITGTPFMREKKGPVPRRLVPVRESLIDQKRAVIKKVKLFSGNEQHRLIALDEPDLSIFTSADIDIVTAIIDALWNKTAEQVSDLSHELPAWELADDKEDIPIEAAFILSIKATAQAASLCQLHAGRN